MGAIDLLQVCISAQIDGDGNLDTVGHIQQKIDALETAKNAHDIKFLIVAKNQPGIWPTRKTLEKSGIRIIQASTLVEALEQVYRESSARVALEKKARDEINRHSKLIGRPIHDLRLLLYDVSADMQSMFRSSSDLFLPYLSGLSDMWDEDPEALHTSYRTTILEEVFSIYEQTIKASPSLVLIGQNGSGKTDYLYYAAWLAVEQHLKWHGHPLTPVRIELAHWETWAQHHSGGLDAYLRAVQPDWPAEDVWETWVNNSDMLFLFDGLDDLRDPGAFITVYLDALRDIQSCPILLSCRTGSFPELKDFFEGFQHLYLGGLTEQQQIKFVTNYFHCCEVREAVLFLEQIRSIPNLRYCAANPRLLASLCQAAQESKACKDGIHLPVRQTDILERIVTNLLHSTLVSGKSETPERLISNLDNLLSLLGYLTLDLFLRKIPVGDPLPVDIILDALEKGLKKESLCIPGKARNVARLVLWDLEHNSGLLVKTAELQTSYRFLHRSIYHYLLARCLANWINEGSSERRDKKRPLYLHRARNVSRRELFNRLSWDEKQEETLIYLAGLMRNPAELIEELANPVSDDLYMHCRSLAARCLLEVSAKDAPWFTAVQKQLARDILQYWFKTDPVIDDDYFIESVWALARLNVPYEGEPLDAFLVYQLRATRRTLKLTKLIPIFSGFRSLQVSPRVIACLGDMLSGKVLDAREAQVMRDRALDVIIELGPAAAHEEILKPLADLLRRKAFRSKEMFALREMGRGAATITVRKAVGALLETSEQTGEAWISALDLIQTLGMGGDADISNHLRAFLAKPARSELEGALISSALAECSLDAFTETERNLLFAEISACIWESESERVRQLGREAALHVILNAGSSEKRKIFTQMMNTGAKQGDSSEETVGLLSNELVKEQLIRNFLGWLKDRDEEHRLDGDRLLRQVGSLGMEARRYIANSPQAMLGLLEWIRVNEDFVNDAALETFRLIVPSSPNAEIAALLLEDLRYADPHARLRIAEILGFYGKAAAQTDILKTICIQLKTMKIEADRHWLHKILPSLASMGAAAAMYQYPDNGWLLEIVADLLKKSGMAETEETMRAIYKTLAGLIGAAVVASCPTERLIPHLQFILNWIDNSNESAISDELKILHHYGLRFFRGADGRISVKSIQDLCNVF